MYFVMLNMLNTVKFDFHDKEITVITTFGASIIWYATI
jgi:hypothetical protein